MKKFIKYGLVILFLIPLFFINIKTSHDWGDDFAQYLHQAQNILAGISQNETGYVFNENCYTAPIAYPTGFPLLLVPIVYFFGINFFYLNLYMSLFLVLASFVGFLILRKHMSFINANCIMLVIAYNPLLINFKAEVLSDLPFIFFSLLCIYLIINKQNLWLSIFLGLLMAFTLHIRTAGIALIVTYLIYRFFIESSWKDFSISIHQNNFVTILTGLVFYFFFHFEFPCDVNYTSTPIFGSYWEMLNDHFSYNMHQISYMFRWYDMKSYFSIGVVASSFLLVFSILGFFYFFKENKKSFLTGYTFIYLGMVINHRSSHQGLRFIYPIIFILFLFAAIGIKTNLQQLLKQTKYFGLVSAMLILFSYNYEIAKIYQTQNVVVDGPQLPESKMLFSFINLTLSPNSIIAFDKPRALALYTKVKSFTFAPNASQEIISNDIKRLKANFILTNETQSSEEIKKMLINDTLNYHLIFNNKLFKLFAINR